MKAKRQVLVVEPSDIVREGLRALLEHAAKDATGGHPAGEDEHGRGGAGV